MIPECGCKVITNADCEETRRGKDDLYFGLEDQGFSIIAMHCFLSIFQSYDRHFIEFSESRDSKIGLPYFELDLGLVWTCTRD